MEAELTTRRSAITGASRSVSFLHQMRIASRCARSLASFIASLFRRSLELDDAGRLGAVGMDHVAAPGRAVDAESVANDFAAVSLSLDVVALLGARGEEAGLHCGDALQSQQLQSVGVQSSDEGAAAHRLGAQQGFLRRAALLLESLHRLPHHRLVSVPRLALVDALLARPEDAARPLDLAGGGGGSDFAVADVGDSKQSRRREAPAPDDRVRRPLEQEQLVRSQVQRQLRPLTRRVATRRAQLTAPRLDQTRLCQRLECLAPHLRHHLRQTLAAPQAQPLQVQPARALVAEVLGEGLQMDVGDLGELDDARVLESFLEEGKFAGVEGLGESGVEEPG